MSLMLVAPRWLLTVFLFEVGPRRDWGGGEGSAFHTPHFYTSFFQTRVLRRAVSGGRQAGCGPRPLEKATLCDSGFCKQAAVSHAEYINDE